MIVRAIIATSASAVWMHESGRSWACRTETAADNPAANNPCRNHRRPGSQAMSSAATAPFELLGIVHERTFGDFHLQQIGLDLVTSPHLRYGFEERRAAAGSR